MRIKRYILFFILPFLLLSLPGNGQISHPGLPTGIDYKNVPFIKLQGVNRDKLISSEEQERLMSGKKTLRFGKILPVSLGTDNSGIFQTFNQLKVWRIGFWSPDARGLGLIFDRFDLDDGEKVFIYSPGKEQVLGAFTGYNMNKNKTLAVMPLSNDSIIIEFQFKTNRKDALHIGSVVYDYLGIYSAIGAKDEWYNASGPCNVDINCPEGQDWQSEKNAVCRELIYKSDHGYSELCTGVLLNNTSETDAPYLLTSNHCIENNSHAENTMFVFQYESPYCEGPDGVVIKSISGSDLKATTENLDFTLVELSKIPPITYNPIYAGWSNKFFPPENSVSIHHPNGDVKKISVDNDPAVVASYSDFDDNAFWNILQWEVGTTEAGSSGAPLFDQDHRVIGILSGGDAHCGNSVNDYFLRFANAWDDYSSSGEQLKFWLDPDNSGATSVNQRDPYVATGINNHSDIVVYRNPGNGLFSFIPNGFTFGTIRVQMFNLAGYILKEFNIEFTGSRIDLDLTGMVTGLYIIRISQGAKNETFKVSIIR